MNKREFAEYIAKNNEIEVSKAVSMMNVILGNLESALAKGNSVKIKGFGTFEVKETKAHICRNPRNPEEEVEVPAYKSVKFKQSTQLKKAVNED